MPKQPKVLLLVLFVGVVMSEDSWIEESPKPVPTGLVSGPDAEAIDSPILIEDHPKPIPTELVEGPGVEAIDSPIFLQSDGKKCGFSPDKYAALKEHLVQMAGKPFTMKHFDGSDHQMVLETIEAFTPDGLIRTMHADGTESTTPPPEMVHLHGSVSGDPQSFVMLNLSPKGSMGIVHTSSKRLSLEQDKDGHSILLDAEKDESRRTEEDKTAARYENAAPDEIDLIRAPPGSQSGKLVQVGAKYALSVMIDVDQAGVGLLQQNTGDASGYITGLIAGTNVLYKRDIGRELRIAEIKLWDRPSPFNRGTNSLSDLRKFYNNNKFDLVHLFTGIRQGGVAYVRTACRGSSGYNTGVSSLRGKWKGTQQASAYNWDLIVTAHEIGHNVGSGHSHDYSPPIDQCVACKPGFTPSQCLSGGSTQAPVSRSDPRCVRGTVMSYCHLCGGTQNVDIKFHPRAIKVIKDNLDKNCGPAGPAPPPSPPGPSPTPPPAPPPGPGDCKDKNPAFCAKYTPKYCSSRVRFQDGSTESLRSYCPKGCGQCSPMTNPPSRPPSRPPTKNPTRPPTKAPTTEECEDANQSEPGCAGFKKAGYCQAEYVDYMKKNCAQTCGFCQSGGGDPNCKDQNEARCRSWGTKYCKGYSYAGTPVSEYCEKTCGSC